LAIPRAVAVADSARRLAKALTLSAGATWSLLAALIGFILVVTLSANDGGYWPLAWSWTTLALAWSAVLILVLGPDVHISRLQWLFLGLFAALSIWVVASVTWTTSAGSSLLEAERVLAYLALILASTALMRRRSYVALLAGIWASVSLISAYALATRLFPDRLGVFDAVAEYRLSEPLGYWNALGIFAGIGAILAIGLAARSSAIGLRVVAASSLLLFLPTMYFTFSRGAWIASAIGVVACLALDPRRLQLAMVLLALTPATALGLAIAYRSDALTHQGAQLANAGDEGHELALVLLGLAVVNGLVAVGFSKAERLLAVPQIGHRVFGYLALLALVAVLAGLVARHGGPTTVAAQVQEAFAAPGPRLQGGNLNQRLFNFSGSGRVDVWRTARASVNDHPWLGSGAGAFEGYWLQHRPYPMKVRDAHNLYLEVWSELGPLGVALLVASLVVPVGAALSARRSRLVPAAFGAYVAYLAHASVDWDWEMPVVTVTALLCGVAILSAACASSASRSAIGIRSRWTLVAVSLVLAAVGFIGINGNGALADAQAAATAGRFAESKTHVDKAIKWMPWSSQPWRLLGEVELAGGDVASAQRSFRTAIDKDPNDWELWLDLADASGGSERRAASLRAIRLNPLAPELGHLQRILRLNETVTLHASRAIR
jgi:hypothetical protein